MNASATCIEVAMYANLTISASMHSRMGWWRIVKCFVLPVVLVFCARAMLPLLSQINLIGRACTPRASNRLASQIASLAASVRPTYSVSHVEVVTSPCCLEDHVVAPPLSRKR